MSQNHEQADSTAQNIPQPYTRDGVLAYFRQFLNGDVGLASAEVLTDLVLQVQHDTEQRVKAEAT